MQERQKHKKRIKVHLSKDGAQIEEHSWKEVLQVMVGVEKEKEKEGKSGVEGAELFAWQRLEAKAGKDLLQAMLPSVQWACRQVGVGGRAGVLQVATAQVTALAEASSTLCNSHSDIPVGVLEVLQEVVNSVHLSNLDGRTDLAALAFFARAIELGMTGTTGENSRKGKSSVSLQLKVGEGMAGEASSAGEGGKSKKDKKAKKSKKSKKERRLSTDSASGAEEKVEDTTTLTALELCALKVLELVRLSRRSEETLPLLGTVFISIARAAFPQTTSKPSGEPRSSALPPLLSPLLDATLLSVAEFPSSRLALDIADQVISRVPTESFYFAVEKAAGLTAEDLDAEDAVLRVTAASMTLSPLANVLADGTDSSRKELQSDLLGLVIGCTESLELLSRNAAAVGAREALVHPLLNACEAAYLLFWKTSRFELRSWQVAQIVEVFLRFLLPSPKTSKLDRPSLAWHPAVYSALCKLAFGVLRHRGDSLQDCSHIIAPFLSNLLLNLFQIVEIGSEETTGRASAAFGRVLEELATVSPND